jgi:hypothetical protein
LAEQLVCVYLEVGERAMDVELVEEFIMNPAALPSEFAGWRRYRIEYGGHAEQCLLEETIYLPAHVDADALEALINGCSRWSE